MENCAELKKENKYKVVLTGTYVRSIKELEPFKLKITSIKKKKTKK
jgi:hypothetical protein